MQKKAMIYVGKESAKALQIIRSHTAEVLANYGQSVLVRADEEGLRALAAEGLRVRELPDTSITQMRGFKVDPARLETLSPSAAAAAGTLPSGVSYHLLHLAGPMHPDWKNELERMKVVVYERLPNDFYLIGIDSPKLTDLQALAFVESVVAYHPSLKVNQALLTSDLRNTLEMTADLTPIEPQAAKAPVGREDPLNRLNKRARSVKAANPDEEGNLQLVLFNTKDQTATLDALHALGVKIIKASSVVIVVFADLQLVPRLAAIPQVREINPFHPPTLYNDVATGIINANILQNDHKLDGSGQIIGIADTGLDTGVNDATILADFQGRIVNIHALGRPGDASDIDNHGTHVAGSVLGDGANSNGKIRGIAPAAELVFQSTMDADRGLGGIPPDLRVGFFDDARDDGARIHTNSWGLLESDGIYSAESDQADDFAFTNRRFLILFAAGNDAPLRVSAPGTAKNVLTVGASESIRPLPASVSFPASPVFPGGATLPNLDDQADSQNQVSSFSCPGPADNNRRKPDVVAPGTWILSTRSSVSTADTGPDGISDTGDEDGSFTHSEAVGLGLPGQPILGGGDENTPAAPAGSGAAADQNYMYSSGTSMATPVTAGACALVRQYLIEQRGHNPSAALLKALVINGAVDMGMGIPHNEQGWGRIDLNNSLFPPGTNRIQFDDTLDNAVATGDIRTYDVFVSSDSGPLVVTLVWRDPPGNTIQNEVHLRVIHVDSGTTSTSDPVDDIRNNVQKVVLFPPQLGLYHIEVEGVNVTTGVPELLPALRQDYALVVANATGFSCNPSDIVQVIDRSGSMGFSGYMEPAKERAKQLIDLLQINDKAGVVTFAASASEAFPLTLIDGQGDKDDAHAVIDPITANGMTDLREALEQGMTTLGADLGRPRALVFLSDGKHTVGTPPVDDLLLDSIAAAHVKVYTIALGPDSDFAALNNIAALTGTGAVYSVESAADLHKLHEIYYDILGGLGCGGLVHLSSDIVDLEVGMAQPINLDTTVREAHFALSWETLGMTFDYALKDPTGNILDRNSDRAFHFEGSTHQFYRVSNPKAGLWTMIVKPRQVMGTKPPRVTTAALADSDVKCEVRLDPQFLFHNKLLLSLRVHQGEKPMIGGRANAIITFPTRSIRALLTQHAEELAKIKLNLKALKEDNRVDRNLVKLGILAARLQGEGKDIFARKIVTVELKDDGKNKDPKPGDGIYTGFFDPKKMRVAGSFQVKVVFQIQTAELGIHTCTKLIPVYVPQLLDGRHG